MHNKNIKQINKNLFKNIRLMRWLVLLIISFTFGVGTLSTNAEQALNFIDLNNWSPLGNGTWTVQTGGRTVTQSQNGSPTFFLSPNEYSNVIVKGTIEVNTTNDDDFIGFVMGYENVGDEYEFVLFDWKQALQDGGKEGFNLAQIDGNFSSGFANNVFWDHDKTDSRYTELASPPSNNDGWLDNTEYQFEILYTANQIRIKINGETIYNVTSGNFNAGQIGFYNYSQDGVIYGNVQAVDVDTSSDKPSPSPDAYGVSSNSTLTVNASEGLFFNDYDPNLDDFKIDSYTQPTHGTLTLSTTSGAFSYLPEADFEGIDSFNYNLIETGTDELLTSTSVTVSLSVISGANIAPSDITVIKKENFTEFVNGTPLLTLAAIDANVGDFHDYLLVDNSGGRFGINGNQIILANEYAVAQGETYVIEVKAVDFGGLSVTTEIAINVPYYFNSSWTNELPTELISEVPLVKPSVTMVDNTYVISFSALESISNSAVTIEYSLNSGQDYLPYNEPITSSTLSGIHYRGTDEFDNIRTITDVSLKPYRVYYLSDRYEELGYQDFYLISQGALVSSMLYDFEHHTFDDFYTDRFFLDTRDFNKDIVYAKMNRVFERVLTPSIGDQDFISLPEPSNLTLTERVISNGGVQYTTLSKEFINVSGSNVEFNPHNNHYYMGFKGDSSVQKNWHDAKDFCESKTGYLVTITDQVEWDWVLATFGVSGNDFADVWIGLTDQDNENTFTWITGETNIWTNGNSPWASDEPNDYNNGDPGEDYVQARLTSSLQNWNDLPGNSLKNFMCEFDTSRSDIIDGNQNIQIFDTYYNQNYVITLNPDGGNVENTTLTAAYASSLFNLPTPTKNGYQFDGWINSEDLPIKSQVIDTNETFTAQWSLDNYPIIYNVGSQGSFTPSVISFTMNDSVILGTPVSISGYSFEGWYETDSFVSGTSITSISIGSTQAVTVHAKFIPIIYTITLDVDGGIAEDPIIEAFDTEIRLPATKRPGYTLQGWYDGQERIPYNTRVKFGDRTYTARWNPNLYTLTMTNTANDETDTITAAYGSPIVVPIYSLEGYTFRGWFEGGTNVNFSSMPLGDRTIRAIMEANPYTITFNTGEAPAIPTLEAPYQSTIQLPTPTLENHTFDGWMLNGAIVNLTEMPLNGATLTASFTKLESTITFINPEGNAPAPITTSIGDAITLPTASKTGHTFEGWFLDGSQVSLTTMPELPITLTARFTINQYTLNVNGFNGLRINQITADYGESVTLPVPEQLGYLFAGWTLNGQAFSGNQVSMPAGGGTVNALFDPILYPVSWVYKDEIIQMKLPFESTIPLPVSNVTGYAFEGWQENGTFIDSITVPLRGTTLTAIYRAYQTSQTFYLPGQTAQVTLTTDETFNGPTLNVPSQLVFGGYYTEPFGLGEALSPGDLIENGLDARSYPHVYNPASTYQVPSGETLFTGTIRSSSHTTEPGTPSRTSEIPWLSVAIWGSGILTLVILSERGRRRG